MRNVSKAKRSSTKPRSSLIARLQKRWDAERKAVSTGFGRLQAQLKAERSAAKPKYSIDWDFPVDFYSSKADEARFVERRKDGVWEARNSHGKIITYFGDNFARIVGIIVEPRKRKQVADVLLRSPKSGSIAKPRAQRESTQYAGKIQRGITDAHGFHCRD